MKTILKIRQDKKHLYRKVECTYIVDLRYFSVNVAFTYEEERERHGETGREKSLFGQEEEEEDRRNPLGTTGHKRLIIKPPLRKLRPENCIRPQSEDAVRTQPTTHS